MDGKETSNDEHTCEGTLNRGDAGQDAGGRGSGGTVSQRRAAAGSRQVNQPLAVLLWIMLSAHVDPPWIIVHCSINCRNFIHTVNKWLGLLSSELIGTTYDCPFVLLVFKSSSSLWSASDRNSNDKLEPFLLLRL